MSAHTNPGTYPGNPSLPAEVKEKILSTFRHTLNLFGEGKLDDCIIGCDFILKMDARFAPARQLLEKARNPASAVDVSQLEALVATTPTRQERVVAADPARLLVRAVESFNARDFGAAISAAEQVLQVLPGNQDAVEILEKATRKKAAQPAFDGSRQRALAALEAERPDDARRELEQMRNLDPDHPAVALLERRIPAAGAVPSAGPQFAEVKRPVPPPPPDFGGLDFESSDPSSEPAFGSGSGFGGATNEPDIHFDDGATVSIRVPPSISGAAPSASHEDGGLDALSLDSLSLDLPPSVAPVTPPSGGRSGLGGPLQQSAPPPPPPRAAAPPPPPPPPADPTAPPDLWSEGSGGLDLEEPMEDVPSAPSPYASAPPPPPPPMFHPADNADLEEEEARAGEREIAALLKQGDDAAHRGDRQQAIEVWSRIFLIDINNSEAVTRIEKARQDMAEGNRVISEGLKNGREIYERGDLAGARELFLQVLTADENEPTARFYLDRIQEEMANPGATPAEMPAADGSPGAPATAGAPKSAAAQAAASKERARKGKIAIPRTVLAVVGAFALLVLGGVYFFVLRAPRSGAGAAGSPAGSAPGSLARARQLLGSGKIGEARAELRRVPASSKDYAEAQKTLTELGKPSGEGAAEPATGAPMSVASETGAPPPAPIDAEPARMRAAAERHLAEKHYIDAMKSFSLAAPSFRNDPTFAQSMGVAAEKVTALTPAVKLYNEAEYETAIPILWRIYQEDRDNQDAKSYLLRAYYNQGITQLQNGMYPKAIESFNEALTLDATDSETIRHRKFAERYLKTDLDLMGRIYVRHLNHRP